MTDDNFSNTFSSTKSSNYLYSSKQTSDFFISLSAHYLVEIVMWVHPRNHSNNQGSLKLPQNQAIIAYRSFNPGSLFSCNVCYKISMSFLTIVKNIKPDSSQLNIAVSSTSSTNLQSIVSLP